MWLIKPSVELLFSKSSLKRSKDEDETKGSKKYEIIRNNKRKQEAMLSAFILPGE